MFIMLYLDDGADADGVGLRNLAVAEHLEAGRGAFEQTRDGGADQVGDQQAGGTPRSLGTGWSRRRCGQGVGHAGVQRGAVRWNSR